MTNTPDSANSEDRKRSEYGNEMSESAQKNSQSGIKQSHENRENPDADHVPGHKGYSREDLRDVVKTSDDHK